MKALPPDVSYTIAYDRTTLIDRAVATLEEKAGRGKHRRRAGVHRVSIAFPQRAGGDHHSADRDADLVRRDVPPGHQLEHHVARRHRHRHRRNGRRGDHHDRERAQAHRTRTGQAKPHWQIIRDASIEVGPTLFYSLLVITVSFLPVFALQAQEGRLFKPLAFTKTYSMAAAALLSITLAPVLMGYLIRGRIRPEEENPINRFFIWIYHPVIDFVIRWRWAVIAIAALVVVWVFFPWNRLVTNYLPQPLRPISVAIGKFFPYQNLGSEFMPPLYEGDLLYMPTTFPGISTTKAREILQQTDQIIKSFPEVHHVFGKIGRAETATDPAPMDMIETTIMLKDEKDWPKVDIKDANGQDDRASQAHD